MKTRVAVFVFVVAFGVSSGVGQFKAAQTLPLFFFDGGTIVDVNHDGQPDLISINQQNTDAIVEVAFGKPDGTFGPTITSDIGPLNTPPNLALFGMAADFNGDGQMDIVLLGFSAPPRSLFVSLGNGDGTFRTALTMPVDHFYSAFTAADLNGDGKVDLIAINFNDFPFVLSIFNGNGDGTFQAATDIPLNGEPAGVSIGDFNRDGKPDLAVADSSQQLTIFLNNGAGTFTPKGPFPTGTGSNTAPFAMSLAAADLNNDGKLDIVITDSVDGKVSILSGNGDGTFGPFTQLASGSGTFSVSVNDLNEDGNPDIIVENRSSNGIGVLLGNGNGTFEPVVNYGLPSGLFIGPVFAADFNHDGHIDVANFQGVAFGAGDGTLPLTATATQLGLGATAVATADFNGDGFPDFITSNLGDSSAVPPVPGSLTVGLGRGDGSFTVSTIPSGTAALGVATGDFNKDGKSDFVLANTTNNVVSFYAGNGDGSFQPPVDFAVDPNPNNISVADVNKDGNLDLIVTHGTFSNPGRVTPERFAVLLGDGDGTFQPAQFITPTGNSILPVQLAVADFNGDGNLDFVVGDELAGAQTPYFGNGTGGFSQLPFFGDNSTTSIAAGDFNGDGHPDVAVIDTAVPSVRTLINNGFGTAFVAVDTPSFPSPDFLVAADFDGDGELDIATNGIGGVSTFKGNGDGSFQPPVNYANGLSFSTLATADLNGDAAPDILAIGGNVNPTLISLLNLRSSPVTFPSGFSFVSSQTSASVTAGQSTAFSATMTGFGGFSGQVSFSCSGLPALTACNFSPATLTAISTPSSVALTITTTGAGTGVVTSAGLRKIDKGLGLGPLYLAGIVAICFGMSGKSARKAAGRSLGLLLVASTLFLSSCGGGSGTPIPPTPTPTPAPTPAPHTAAGTYLLQIRAASTATNGKPVVHVLPFTLTVK